MDNKSHIVKTTSGSFGVIAVFVYIMIGAAAPATAQTNSTIGGTQGITSGPTNMIGSVSNTNNTNTSTPIGGNVYNTTYWLQIARFHLTQGINDIKTGNTQGGLIQLTMADNQISRHIQEMQNITTKSSSSIAGSSYFFSPRR